MTYIENKIDDLEEDLMLLRQRVADAFNAIRPEHTKSCFLFAGPLVCDCGYTKLQEIIEEI